MKKFLLCACLLLTSLSAHAQKISIGVVDEDKLAQGYTKYREAIVALWTKQAQKLGQPA